MSPQPPNPLLAMLTPETLSHVACLGLATPATSHPVTAPSFLPPHTHHSHADVIVCKEYALCPNVPVDDLVGMQVSQALGDSHQPTEKEARVGERQGPTDIRGSEAGRV